MPTPRHWLSDAELARARVELGALGYRVELRQSAWWECRISSAAHGEDWLGRGDDENEAFTRALSQLFPSYAARSAFEASLTPPSSDAAAEEITRPVDATLLDMPTLEVPISEQAEALAAPSAPTPSAPPRSHESTTVEVAIPRESDHTRPMSIEASILRDLEELRAVIVDADEDVAVMAPRLQRLHILGWAAQVRALEALVPGSREVELAGGSAIAILGRMARTYWPGTVRALMRSASPRDCVDDLRARERPAPSSWDDVARLAAEALEGMAARSVDEYGWADAAQLAPPPPDPDGMLAGLAQLCARAEKTLEETLTADAALATELTDAARRLRWLRGHVADDKRWGAAVGALRRILSHHPAGLEAVATLLDPAHRPPKAWATVVGYDPNKRQRQRLRRQALTTVPRPTDDLAIVGSWLVGAIEAGLTNDEVVERLRPQADSAERRRALGELEPPPDAERRIRSRFRRAIAALAGVTAPTEGDAGSDDDDASLDDPAPATERLIHPLVARARELVAGQRALFVSNREDPELHARLEHAFGLDITWCVADPRRVEAQTDRIRHGAYDIVLSATGFQSHSVDRALSGACRAAKLRLVRVDHGRPLACARALARQYGLPRTDPNVPAPPSAPL